MLSSPKIREVPVHHEVTESIACTAQDLPAKLGRVYGEIANWAAKKRVQLSTPFARYRSFSPSMCKLEAGYVVDRAVSGDESISAHDDGGYTALTVLHTGPFSTVSKAYAALEEFMHIHGYVSAGPPIEYYLTPPDTAPEQQRTEIVWPVAPNEV